MNSISEFIKLINVHRSKYTSGRHYKLHVASKERKILKIDTKNEKNKIYLV